MSAYNPNFLFEYDQGIEDGFKEVEILAALERV